ncbi:aldehyde dehydrogenase family protein [Amycolatopsis palatopharyngis]|uniref:aldehyde dehydrogenase family protein n=1 Tax=Amycolatopsis palatopharyngis TaxID=187982 RepID=UPI0013BE8D65|nr:aldehyde dehydrogenase family protein [Amycolatopsis palatopharyngis]
MSTAHAAPFVNDAWLTGRAEGYERENPAHPGQVVGAITTADSAVVDDAVEGAVHAWADWRRRPAQERGRVLIRAAELVAARVDELSTLLTLEEGKTLAEARGEVVRTAETLRFHGMQAWQPCGEVFHGGANDEIVRTHRVPIGVVGVITPWNFPLNIPAWKIAPALVHGCTVVWKPASYAALTGAALVRILQEAGLPRGVLQFVPGPGARGQQLVEDPRVVAVTFTGSEAVGRRIAGICAARGAGFQLELGGHNPALVLPDADLDLTVRALVTSVVSGSGQKCTAARRILVHDDVRDAVLDRLTAALSQVKIGDGMDPASTIGPLISAEARDEVRQAVDNARTEGADVLVGAAPADDAHLDGGYYVRPTLLATDKPDLSLACEEVFGPVSVVLGFADVDEGFRLANTTRFGLSAAIFTGSERLARRAADEVDAGMVNINQPTTGSELHVPFGGMKSSSAPGPKEQGQTARDFFTETKAIYATAVR